MLEGVEKAFAAADAETEQDRSRKEQGWSTPKLPRWSSLVPEGQKVEGKGSEPPVLRLSILQDKTKIHSEETGAQLVSGWH